MYFSIDLTEDSGSDILIPGSAARNRGVHGDLVAVEILPKSEWRGRSLVIHEAAQGTIVFTERGRTKCLRTPDRDFRCFYLSISHTRTSPWER